MSDHSRLDASLPIAKPRTNEPARLIECLECGEAFAPRQHDAEFCCEPHRKTFNNRVMTRAVVFYSIIMAGQYDAREEGEPNWISLLSRQASIYHREDIATRAGRRSWRRIGKVIRSKPLLTDKTYPRWLPEVTP